MRKSVKELHSLYSTLEEDDDEAYTPYVKRESALDYFDEEEE